MALLAGGLLLQPGVPASADPRIGLSADGRSYADSLTGPLFDPAVRWVPGDVRTGTLWVRNESGETADLAVTLDAPALAGPLARGELSITGRAGDGESAPVAAVPATVAAVPDLAPGASVPLELRVAMAAGADESTFGLTGDLGLQVRLTGTAGDGGGRVAGVADGLGDELAATGTTVRGWVVVLGLLAVGAGAVVLGPRRAARRTT